MMMMMMTTMLRCTLGVSIVLYNHGTLHPDTLWSSSYHPGQQYHHHYYCHHHQHVHSARSSSNLHRTAYQSGTTTSECENQVLSERINELRLSAAIHHARQPSNIEDHRIRQCRLLPAMVTVHVRNSSADVFQDI